jgi:hypothetical protein
LRKGTFSKASKILLTVGYEAQFIPVDDDVYLVNMLVKTIKKMAKTDNVTKQNAVP